LKILLVFTYNTSLEIWNNTGIFNREISLYRELIEKGVDISFLTFGSKKDLEYSKKISDIKIYPVYSSIRSNIRRFSLIKSGLLPIKLKNLFKNTDIIKTNQLAGSWITWLSKILYNKKIIMRGGFEWLKFYILKNQSSRKKSPLNYWLRYFWIYFVELISYKLADRIILTNPNDIDFIIDTFNLKRKREKISLIYNFIDTEIFKPLNLKKKDKSILFIGRFEQQKNLLNLLNALKELEGFTLDLIGQGPLKPQLIEKAEQLSLSKRINFLGVFPNDEIPEIINRHLIFILPSQYEGNPKVLLEAMSCGVACIGSNVWGIKNIINHKENGYLCNTSSESIRDAILSVNNDEKLRKEICLGARKFIIETCSLKSTAEKEFKLYKNLLK